MFRQVEFFSKRFPRQRLTDPVVTVSQTCPRRHTPLRPLGLSSKARFEMWTHILVLGRSGASKLLRMSKRKLAILKRGAWSVYTWWRAFAPGHDGVGGDMLRRRRSCFASAFLKMLVV